MSGIQMALLGSGGPPIVNFANQTVIAVNSGAPAAAAYRVDNDGSDYKIVNFGTAVALSNWVIPASAGGDYEVFATLTSGSLSSGTTGSWLATSGDPAWRTTASVAGTTAFAGLSLQVRAVGTGTVLDTWTVNLDAERL
jgi:hypothetical protein